MQSVRIYEMPDCKMVSSGVGMFGEERFNAFDAWFSAFPRSLFPKDFLTSAEEGFIWLYQYEEGMEVPEMFDIVDFPGGLYAVSTGIDGKTDHAKMAEEMDVFLAENGFEREDSRPALGNVITPPAAMKVMGYGQMDYYFPIKGK